QAEDGIRDGHVTGVQTCALPISPPTPRADPLPRDAGRESAAAAPPARWWSPRPPSSSDPRPGRPSSPSGPRAFPASTLRTGAWRSEERRVGNERRERWWAGSYTV